MRNFKCDEVAVWFGGYRFTPREFQVLGVMVSWPGLTRNDIGRLLGISGQTVIQHQASIMREFGVNSRLRVFLKAQEIENELRNLPAA